ncbi:MAG: hypothetical protein QM754_16580 [Tepidisphaeraceae bacterium]
MKNATKHAENLKSLIKKLTKEGRPEPKQQIDPLRALVLGVLSFDAPPGKPEQAMAIIDKEFVDINELRVATELEVIEIIGPKYPGIERRALMFREILNAIFEKEHTLSFERIGALGKKESRAALRELPDMTPFVEAYTMLYGFDASAAPVDDSILEVLTESGSVEEGTNIEDAQKFVEGHLKADELHEFYVLVRRAAAASKKSK